jgi:cbb3-type cytochrome oxidase subunit 3
MNRDCKTILTVALAIPFVAYVAITLGAGGLWPLWAWLLWG